MLRLEAAQSVPSLPSLAVLSNPQELLGQPTFVDLLVCATSRFDAILIDTPAGGYYADAEFSHHGYAPH
jgi:receptor protein-tyrosine kinase